LIFKINDYPTVMSTSALNLHTRFDCPTL
jgi:hypothetical protein